MSRGFFLSLDGLDGAGKSTQCRLLADWLQAQGQRVVLTRDPGGTNLGNRIREILLNSQNAMSLWSEAFLYMASRAQLVEEVIRPELEQGACVVCDRFLLANVVYQGHAGGLPVEKLWEIGLLATGGLEPDLTLVLDLPPHAAAKRKPGPGDRMESRGEDFHARVRQGYLAEAKRRPDKIQVIGAGQPIEIVRDSIRREVARVLGARPRP